LHEDGCGILYATQAIRPFYIRATVREFSERVRSREGTRDWEPGAATPPLFDSAQPSLITADGLAEETQDQADPTQMPAVMRQSAERRRDASGPEPRVTLKAANELRAKLRSLSGRDRSGRARRLKRAREQRLRSSIDTSLAQEALAAVDPQMIVES